MRSWLSSIGHTDDDVEMLLRLKQEILDRGENLTFSFLCKQPGVFKGSKNSISKHLRGVLSESCRETTLKKIELFDKTFDVTKHSSRDIRLTFRLPQHPVVQVELDPVDS